MKKLFYSQIYTIVLTLFIYLLILLRTKEVVSAAYLTALIAALNIYFTPMVLFKIFNNESIIHLTILNASLSMTAGLLFTIVNILPKLTGKYLLSAYIGAILISITVILIIRTTFKSLGIKKINVIFAALEVLIIGAGFFLIPLIIKF